MPAAAALPQLSTAGALWTKWKDVHQACSQALSSAANIAERLEVLLDGSTFEKLSQRPEVHRQVLARQLASFNKALALIHSNHEVLHGVVRDMERLHIEAVRVLSSAGNLEALTAPSGPQPSAVKCAELLHDMWVMCRNELLMKIAAVSLVTLDIKPADMAALLMCYGDQPNVVVDRIDTGFALVQETAPPKQA